VNLATTLAVAGRGVDTVQLVRKVNVN